MARLSRPVNIPATGGAGMAPPPGAPIETTAPGSERPTAEQIAAARAHEVEMPAFVPQPMSRDAQVAMIGEDAVRRAEAALRVAGDGSAAALITAVAAAAGGVTLTDHVDGISTAPAPAVTSSFKPVDTPLVKALRRPGAVRPAVTTAAESMDESTGKIILTDADVSAVAGADAAGDVAGDAAASAVEPSIILPPQPAPPPPYQPAASDTDTPSRGLPKAVSDPGKAITGGFGDVGDAQYVPLDGRELGELILALMDGLAARIPDDLRFSMAATYPRVAARVVVEVDCYVKDQSFQIVKIMVPHDKTPMAVARAHGDQVVFAVVEERREMTEDGTSVAPPNQTRMELGLPVPRKQMVQTPGGRQIVDVTQ